MAALNAARAARGCGWNAAATSSAAATARNRICKGEERREPVGDSGVDGAWPCNVPLQGVHPAAGLTPKV